MTTTRIFEDPIVLAAAVAKHVITVLAHAIDQYQTATWVLAGGSTPNLAYEYITANYLEDIDWSKVTFIIGDERIGALSSPDNNWQKIDDLFLQFVPAATFLRPQSDHSAELAARNYESQLGTLPATDIQGVALPRLDIVWLGMGPDGHTLSLFPGHDDTLESRQIVVPVHNSPKPPMDRISLTLHALGGAQQTVIIASGTDKKDAVAQAQKDGSQLPIAYAARATNATWFLDKHAAGVDL